MNKRYNLEYLQEMCCSKNIKLVEDYSDKKILSQTFIKFECIICKEHAIKQFINIEKFNALCKNCSCFTSKNRIKFDIIFLNKICKEKSIVTTKDYSLESLNSLTQIEFNCIDCNNTVSKRFQYIQKYDAKCNNCSNKYGKCKANKTILTKYGVENISQLEEVKNRKKETTLKNYGVEHNSQCQLIKDKKIKTCLKNNGVEHPQQSKIIYNKTKETCIKNYGVEHPQQCKEIMEKTSKNSYNIKFFKFPSGKDITCQGYEPFALDELVKIEEESNILTGCKNVPTIWYDDEDGKKHRHYVDIYIPNKNKCIEVKSTWTIKDKKANIFLKQKAAKELGYSYEIWVYDKNGNKVETFV